MSDTIVIGNLDVEFLHQANSIHGNNDEHDKYYFAKTTKRDNVVGAWHMCELTDQIENVENPAHKKYVVRFISNGCKGVVAEYELASRLTPDHSVLRQTGTRIIARRSTDEMPHRIDGTGEKIQLFASNENEYYPGIVAGAHVDRYLIFFDDGIVQLIKRKFIRRVKGDDQINHAHWNAKQYFDFFLKNDQMLARLTVDMELKVELNGDSNAMAKVLEIEGPLAKIHFESINRCEWIYLGSPRISAVYRELLKTKFLDNYIQYKTYNACLSANDDVVIIDTIDLDDVTASNPKNDVSQLSSNFNVSTLTKHQWHECCHQCVKFEDKINIKLDFYTIFQRPLLVGWTRHLNDKKISYQSPCGVIFHKIHDVEIYLMKTDSKLRVDCFEFSKNVIIDVKEEIDDNSNTKYIGSHVEKLPIAICDVMSTKDKAFTYIKDYNFDYVATEPENNLGRTGCNCTDNCRNKLKCTCWQLTVKRLLGRQPNECEYKMYEKISYKHMRLMEIVFSGIVECGSNCDCCVEQCVNRVIQHGLQHKLELFKTKDRGWGVRTTADIPAAMFVCDYVGAILKNSAADKRDVKYQFKLPNFSSDSDSESDGEPEPKILRTGSDDDVIQPFLNYFPFFMQNGNANNFPESEHNYSHEKYYVVDALHQGNVSRFINHSCDPNLFVQAAYDGDDKRFPRLAFFSSQPIKAGEELTIDYMYELIEGGGTPCYCGTSKCRKRLT